MTYVPLRVWADGCDDAAIPGSFIREKYDASVFSSIGDPDNVYLPPRNNALPPSRAPGTSHFVCDDAGGNCEGGISTIHARLIETAEVDGPMELRTEDEFEGEKEDNDDRNGPGSDDDE